MFFDRKEDVCLCSCKFTSLEQTMTSKIISFTVPVATTDFNVIIDDGRIYRVHRTSTLLDHETVIAEVNSDALILSCEYSEPASEGGEGMKVLCSSPQTTILGHLVDEPNGDDLILGYTIREGTSPLPPTNLDLLSSLYSSFNAASTLFTNELRKFNEENKVSETTKEATDRVAGNLNAIDQTYKISETVQGTANSIDDRYHVRDNVRSAAKAVSDATIDASNRVMSQANAINETYHVTENLKSALDTASKKAQELDEKYHVMETVKGTADAVVNEARKASEAFGTADETEVTQETTAVPEKGEETH
jgi:hypothetical protein